MYEVGTSWVEGIEQKCSLHIRKWLKLPKKNISNTAIYGKKRQFTLPIPSIFELYKAGKAQAINDTTVF